MPKHSKQPAEPSTESNRLTPQEIDELRASARRMGEKMHAIWAARNEGGGGTGFHAGADRGDAGDRESGQPPPFPNLPGWHFSVMETSMSVYRVEGLHADGRTVCHVGHDLPLLIKEIGEDAQTLTKGHKA
jgi:hypothetical protein